MPDKTTPHIQRAAREWYDSLCQWVNAGADREAATIRAFEAILSTTLEPSEAEIEAATLAYLKERAYREKRLKQPHSEEPVIYDDIKAGLIAAARVRLGSQGADL